MAYEQHQIKQAYIKLKSYIYYDNTDILLRRKLVEFESNRTKEEPFLFWKKPKPYDFDEDLIDLGISASVEKKLNRITDELNKHHKAESFFNYFLDNIKVSFYPKKIKDELSDSNYITNERIYSSYEAQRVTAFIDAPIELHILSVLWILEVGFELDASLSDNCFGNRLILNHAKDSVVRGSGLFKPYFKQYQKWRDESVDVAQGLLKKGKDVLFLTLDIKDYFHSVRIPTEKIYERKKRTFGPLKAKENLKLIFLKMHLKYTELVARTYQIPNNFYGDLSKDDFGDLTQVILPIGLLSSYVLANDYLKSFDQLVAEDVRPAYYGRYVDDILIVLSNPSKGNESIGNNRLSDLIQRNFATVFEIVDAPEETSRDTDDNQDKWFKIKKYDSLYCQAQKSLAYYFNHEESDIVIDKLKKDLEARTSEFRDFPEENNDDSFEESAYHLQYDGSDGKIRTLKDYKEDRFGLTVYLANKIFSALRHERKIDEDEKNQVLKFFRGYNCLSFYRLWERVFTFFLVNGHADAYVSFYLHCARQIDAIRYEGPAKITGSDITHTMLEYLDCANELSLALDPSFLRKAKRASRNFEFQMNSLAHTNLSFFSITFEPTRPDSYWIRRFRETNMIRHHYVIHPLLNYTTHSKEAGINLVGLRTDFSKYKLDPELLSNSPRPVKFWECCLARLFGKLGRYKKGKAADGDYFHTKAFGLFWKKEADNSLTNKSALESAFSTYKKLNQNHIPDYELNDETFLKSFYQRKAVSINYDEFPPVDVQEILVDPNNLSKLEKPRIAFANTAVEEGNIIKGMRNEPNISVERYQKLSKIVKSAREEKANVLLFPEFFIPINLLSSLVRFSEKNQVLSVTGLEHVVVSNTAFNFIVTILPLEINGVRDAIVIYRLKNHYAHIEEELIRGNHNFVPKPKPYRYDLFRWRNIYFTTYYCFELANSFHRSLFKGKIDLLVGVEWNKDTPYFSNIVESGSRDLHAFVAQVNTSQYGDTRLTQPAETAKRDILRLKGGINDAILVATIDIPKLRDFQRQKFSITHAKGEFKPLPPDYLLADVLKRIRNESVL